MSRAQVTNSVAWATLIAAAVWLTWRGIWRGVSGDTDLAVRFHAAAEWLAGRDPYVFAEAFDFAPTSLAVDFPPTLPVFVPLTVLSWPDARLLGALASVAAAVFVGFGASRLAGWRLLSPSALLLVAFLIGFAPTITTIAMGQTGLLATAAIVAAMLLERAGRETASGAMYGLATVIKVQIGLPFVAYLLWRRRWSPALASLAVVSGLTLLSVVRMELAGTPWLDTWVSNLGTQSGPGGINDPSPLNSTRLDLLSLQYPLASLISEPELVNVVAFASIGAAALAFVWLRRGRDAHPDLLALAMVAALGLLVTYHRYYDAVLLAVPAAWACAALSGPNWRLGSMVLALCAAFVLPLQSLMGPRHLRLTETAPRWLTDSLAWEVVVLAQYTWTVVLIVLVLLVAAARERRHGSARASGIVPEPPSLGEGARSH